MRSVVERQAKAEQSTSRVGRQQLAGSRGDILYQGGKKHGPRQGTSFERIVLAPQGTANTMGGKYAMPKQARRGHFVRSIGTTGVWVGAFVFP